MFRFKGLGGLIYSQFYKTIQKYWILKFMIMFYSFLLGKSTYVHGDPMHELECKFSITRVTMTVNCGHCD